MSINDYQNLRSVVLCFAISIVAAGLAWAAHVHRANESASAARQSLARTDGAPAVTSGQRAEKTGVTAAISRGGRP